MALPKQKTKTAEERAKEFAESAPSDKVKREPNPDKDMPLLGFRVHRDVEYTLKEKAKRDRRTFSELCRELFMFAIEQRGIEIQPKPPEGKKADVES